MPRGFTSIQEHDRYIVEEWNKLIVPEDTVYILGDLMLCDNEHGMECIRQLNGEKHFIIGNHDSDTRVALYEQSGILINEGFATRIKYKGYTFYLSHYPTITSNYDDDKPLKARVINLCGHTHTTSPLPDWKRSPMSFHCEIDSHPRRLPWLLDDIIQKIKEFDQKTTVFVPVLDDRGRLYVKINKDEGDKT